MDVETSLEWLGGFRFKGVAGGREIALDGHRESGVSPTEALTLALGGCMAIDLVAILEKRRAALRSMRVEIEGTRAETEPRRFTEIRMSFRVAGTGFTASHVERAIELSREKYCSVLHTLRPDLRLETTFAIEI